MIQSDDLELQNIYNDDSCKADTFPIPPQTARPTAITTTTTTTTVSTARPTVKTTTTTTTTTTEPPTARPPVVQTTTKPVAEKVNCQSKVLKFAGRGYFEIPHKLISSKEDIGFTIELSFKTKDSNAPLFYKEGKTGDKISIELKNGKVLLEIIYKALDKSVILQSEKLYDDNEEHTVTVEKARDVKEFTFYVDTERPKTNSLILRPGEQDILDTKNAPLYLGGYPGLSSGGFTGCITYLKTLMFVPTQFGGDSDSKHGPFSLNGVKALNVECASDCDEESGQDSGYFDYDFFS